MELAWWKKEVIYQIFTRSFMDSNNDGIGDLNGITSRLNYVKSLGVGAISLSPFYKTEFIDSGYDITDFKDIDPKVGTLEDFDYLVSTMHNKDLKLIIDLPVDFTSIKHPWFKESSSSKENSKNDYYIWSDNIPNNWLSRNGGKAWTFNEERGQYYMHSFIKEEPDLNWRAEGVIDEFLSIIRFWYDRGVDGINCNAINMIVKDKDLRNNPRYPGFHKKKYYSQRHIFDRNRPFAHRRAKQLREVCSEYKDEEKILLGEVIVEMPGEPELAASFYGGKYKDEMCLVFDYTFINTKFKPVIWSSAAQRWYNATDTSWPAWVISNQFKTRLRSRFKGNIARARLAAMFNLTQRGTPFIYYGDELGMEDSIVKRNQAIDINGKTKFGAKGRDGARSPMLWTLENYAGFSTVKPYLPLANKEANSVESQERKQVSMLHYYQKFISLRKKHEALSCGDITFVDVHDENIICYIRTSNSEALLIILNFANRERKIKLANIGLPLIPNKAVFTTNPYSKEPKFEKDVISLHSYEGAIYPLDV
jgi:alpha-glucosidase